MPTGMEGDRLEVAPDSSDTFLQVDFSPVEATTAKRRARLESAPGNSRLLSVILHEHPISRDDRE